MKRIIRKPGLSLACLILAALAPAQVLADEIRVAVAANFADCLETLAPAFEDSTGHHIVIIRGSTGRHFAQIKSGAPFDVFLAADTQRPLLLEKEGLTALGTRFTYAEGRLALWLPSAELDDHRTAREILESATFHHLAIANPRLAPYGLAAQQVLESMGLWDELQPRLVTGQSVGQTWQFLASGNAEAGFVAIPQILATPSLPGRWWKLDPPLHEPILQQGVVIASTKYPAAAGQFLDFLRSSHARMTMIRFGYLIPEN